MKEFYKDIVVGSKLYLWGEKRGYNVRCRNNRYIIATKPHFGESLYTIIDLEEEFMGPDNLIFSNYGYKDLQGCEEALKDIVNGDIGISRRRGCKLVRPDKIINPTGA